MSKTSGSYDSLIKGVSQQAAHDRLPGQHWSQDNMISDPVRGLSRRHGSKWYDEVPLTGVMAVAEVALDAASRNEDTIFIHGVEYSLFRAPGDTPVTLQPLIMVNKDTRKFVPVQFSAAADALLRSGISTVCTAGEYLLLGSATRPAALTITDNRVAQSSRQVIWIRGGAYSRTFTVTATRDSDGVKTDYSYTTMKSYYDGVLDTSDIVWYKPGTEEPDPAYTSKINNRTNTYNTNVNQHIANAARDITPENIAAKLVALIAPDFLSGFPRSDGPYIVLSAPGYTFTVDDGGNGEFARVASRTITSPELLTDKHFVGKVMTVQPQAAGSQSYYMIAEPKTPGVTGFTDVIWKEAAGEIITPTFLFCIGVLVSGTLYVAQSPEELQDMTGKDVPKFNVSRCGDTVGQPAPELFGRVVTYMRMFQDRLVIIAGSTVFMTKTGDYFNLFRDSMLVVKDDDPIEVFSQGTEDDTITSGTQIDKNVVLFGRRFQYVLPGNSVTTPRSAYVGVVATYEGANIVPPAAAGALIFFCQRRENRLTMQQMQPGGVADRLEAFDVSAQLDGYLFGDPRQIIAQTSPSMVFIKTKELTNGFYTYAFLDSRDQSERLFDSWSRWTFDSRLGSLVGITSDDSGLLAVTARMTTNGVRLVLDRFTRETDLSDQPYLDSLRKGYVNTLHPDGAYAVYDNTSQRYLLGVPKGSASVMDAQYPTESQGLWTGVQFDSHVELTSPYLRDRQDRVILDAKLTVTKLNASLTNTAALVAELSVDSGKTWKVATSWIARPVGGWILNTQRVEEQKTLPIPVMKDNKTYRLRLSSDGWLPLTVSVMEWSGQAFTSRR